QIELATKESLLHLARFAPVLRGVQERRLDAQLEQRIDLVLHKRNKRRNDNARTTTQQRRYLITQGLSAPRGHQNQRIAPTLDMLDDVLLVASERVIAENLLQNV